MNAGSGQRLGGSSVRRGEDIREVIARAAQRRTTVMQGCASDTAQKSKIIEQVDRNSFRTQAEEDDANEQAIMQAYIELIQEEEREKYGKDYIPPSQENPTGGVASPQEQSKSDSMQHRAVPTTARPSPKTTASQPTSGSTPSQPIEVPDDVWTCDICTLNNPLSYLCCDACTTERPAIYAASESHTSRPTASAASGVRSSASGADNSTSSTLRHQKSLQNIARFAEAERNKPLGWVCTCGTFMEHQWWTCSACGRMRQSS